MSYKLKPIKTEKDYNSAIAYLNSIIDASEDGPEAEIKEILTVLIEKYEDKHYSISPPRPIDAIKFRMEQAGLSRNDLIPYIGSRLKVSEVLSGKRDLTLKMIRALNRHLGIPAESLLAENEELLKEDFSNIDFDRYPIKEMQAISLSILKNSVMLTKEYLASHGIILVTIPHLKNTHLDGAAFMTKSGIPIIGMTLRHDRIDNFWFTLLHEIAHIIKHLENCTFIADDMTLRGSSTDDYKEKEADLFAERSLLPKDFKLDKKIKVSKDEVLNYAKINNIHPAIVAGRIQYTQKNYRKFAGLVGRGEVRKYFFG